MIRHADKPRGSARYGESRADRTTIWLLLLVVTALVIALTFSDASGCATGLTELI